MKRAVHGGLFTALVTALDALPKDPGGHLSTQQRQRLLELRERGFVNLGQIPGLDVVELASKVSARFDEMDQLKPAERQYIKHPFLLHPAIADVLRAEGVNELIRAYLGPGATFDKVLLWRVAKISRTVKVSGLWHHDWCGRRLKLFVLLNDQTARDRPTWYAAGSHRVILKWAEYAFSRYQEDFVRWNFQIVPLVGKRGDAILFDTHGFHRATYEAGAGQRDAISYECSNYGKSRLLKPQGYQIGLGGDLFPPTFDATGTLLRADQLWTEGDHLCYGRSSTESAADAADYTAEATGAAADADPRRGVIS
jgi:hypothetical protein